LRVNRLFDVDDVFVLEAAHDVDDHFSLADVVQKLIAKTFTLARAFDQPGNVYEFDGGANDLAGLGDFGERREARVLHIDDADVGAGGAEGVIGALSPARSGERVEES